MICTKLRGSRYSPAFKPRLLGRDPLQQFRRRFVPRVLRHQLAARGQIENEAAQAGQASQLLQLIPLSQAVVVTSRSGTGSFRQVGKLISPASGSLITIKRAVAVTHIIPLISSANTQVLSATSQIVTHLGGRAECGSRAREGIP